MAKIELTDRMIAQIRQKVEYTDSLTPGLMIRIGEGGAPKSWTYRYELRSRDGIIKRRMTIGTYPNMKTEDARIEAGALRAKVRKCEDPAADRNRARRQVLFREVATDWLQAKKIKSLDNYKRMLKKDVLSTPLAELAVHRVEQADIKEVLLPVADRAPSDVNRLHSIIKQILQYAVGEGYAKTNPMAGMARLGRKAKRVRLLTPSEVQGIWHALESRDTPATLALRVHLLIGQRSHEIRNLRIGDVFPQDNGAWAYLNTKQTIDANRRHRVWLVPMALNLVQSAIGDRDDLTAPVFTSTGKKPISKETYRRAHRIDSIDVDDWRPHDFRHLLSTWLYAANGRKQIEEPVIWAIMGHKGKTNQTTRDVYAHASFEAERQEWFAKWADLIRRVVVEGEQWDSFDHAR